MSMSMKGMESLKLRIAGMQERMTTDIQQALKLGAQVVLKSAKQKIMFGGMTSGAGTGWAPNSGSNPLLFRSGRLINSLQSGMPGNIEEFEGTNTIKVGTNLPYAKLLWRGTGIFGPYHTPITPGKPNGVLAFQVGGRTVFARHVKGTPGRKFLHFDPVTRAKVVEVVRAYIMEDPTPFLPPD